jgi:DUF4097 and DUF4098 domain-containing protein YvlB
MRRAWYLPLIAVLLLPAAPAASGEQLTDVARDVARAARTVTRYQGGRDQRAEQRSVERKQVRVGAGGLLELHNIAGDITVTAGGGDTATIEITKIARAATDAEARELLDLVKVETSETAARAEVRAVYPEPNQRNRRRNFNVSTEYRVVAPAGARIRTDTISGDVSVSGIRGELTLGSISGNIVVRDAGQRISGNSISGNVELISAQENAAVELSSTSGNVRANGVHVRRIDMGSVSGSVTGRDIRSEQAELHTVSGNVEYTGSLVPNGRYKFGTHSGDVRLTFDSGTGFELEASTFSGEVRSNLQLRVEGNVSRRNRTVRGTYSNGGARVEANSFSGNVVINGR